MATGREVQVLKEHEDVVNSIAFSPDRRLLASASGYDDRTVHLWDHPLRLFTIAGEAIDWSEGKPEGAPFPQAEAVVVEGGPGVPRDHAALRVIVYNQGKGAVFQLEAETRSNAPAFDKQPLLFGKIEPGVSKTRLLSFPIPKDLKTGAYTVRLVWKELNGFVPSEVTARLDLKALPRPNLLASLRVIDDGTGQSVGNGDGVIQQGEAVDLVLAVKNAGDREAEDATVEVTLPDHPGLQLFGERKVSLGNLPAGAVKEAQFNVAVKRVADLRDLPVHLEVREQSFSLAKGIDERLPFEARIASPVEVLAPRDVFVRAEQADLLSGADLRASRLGYAPRGAALRATGRSGDFYRVEIESGQLAWITTADVSEVPIMAVSSAPSQAAPVRVVLESFPPPAIVLTSPAPGTITDQERVELLGGIRAVGSSLVTETQVFVNGEAVGGERKDRDITGSAGGKQRVDFRRTLALQMGENRIEVVAKDDRGLTARETLVVRRVEPRGPVGKLPPLETLSDVDRFILDPAQPLQEPNPQRWAVIIGIEKYQRTVGAPFARRDAYIMHEYARKLLGVPLENIFLRVDEDATKSALQVVLEGELPRRVEEGDQVFVYYAGHGLADPNGHRPYLLPTDGDPQSIHLSGYSAEAFYGALGQLKAERVVVFLDACFGGVGGRQEELQPLLPGARPGLIVVTDPVRAHKNLTVLAAAQNDQVSNSDPETGHGLFTYHLLKGLMGSADVDRDGRVELVELATYVRDSVDRAARQRYGQTRQQTPVVTPANIGREQNLELTHR